MSMGVSVPPNARGPAEASPRSDRSQCRDSSPSGSGRNERQCDLDGPDVDCLRTLVARFGLVLHARALGERAVALGLDAAVVDEEVLAAFIGRDEAEALLVAEPLDRACCHVFLHGVLRAASAVVAQGQPSA